MIRAGVGRSQAVVAQVVARSMIRAGVGRSQAVVAQVVARSMRVDPDRGERRPPQRPVRGVVEADHRQVVRRRQPEVAERREGGDRRVVAERRDRGDAQVEQAPQPGRGDRRAAHRQPGRAGQAQMPGGALGMPAQQRVERAAAGRPGHREPVVAAAREVRHLGEGVRRQAVDPAAVGRLPVGARVDRGQVDHRARRDGRDGLRRRTVRHQQAVPTGRKLLAQARDEALQARPAGEAARLQHHDPGGALAQGAGDRVRHVAELGRRPPHPFPGRLGDGLPGRVVEHEAHRRLGHAAGAGHVLHRHSRGGRHAR